MEGNGLKMSRRAFLKGTAAAAGLCLVGGSGEVAEALESEKAETFVGDTKPAPEKWFTDSVGRKVRIPDKIREVIPTGNYAQALLCTLCPKKMRSVADAPPADEKTQYEESGMSEIYDLPETGSMYKPEGERDLKTGKIAALESNLIVDAGFIKDDLKVNLEYLQRKSDTPVIFIDASLGKLPQAYRTLGKLLGCSERAEKLALYIEELYADVESKRSKIEHSPRIFYAKNNGGMYKSEGYSVHDEIIRFVGATPIIPKEGNDINKIDIQQLGSESIDYIIFNSEDCYNSILEEHGEDYEIWSQLDAVRDDQYVLSPGIFHSWFGFGFYAQIIGVIWLGRSVMPDVYDYDIIELAKEFYDVFYGYKITSNEIKHLLKIK